MSSKTREKSLLEELNQYMDNHLMEVRLSIAAIGVLGFGIAFRSIRFATKFYSNDKIPKSFVNKNIMLRGIVKSVSTDGTLNVEHIPIVSMPWHSNQKNKERLLNLSLAAIQPNISGVYWLKLNIENKMVSFQIINRMENDINCMVSTTKKSIIKKNLNFELVERGLAVVNPFDENLMKIKVYKHLYKSLIAKQNTAKKSNSGLWYRPNKWDTFKDRFQTIINALKNVKNIV